MKFGKFEIYHQRFIFVVTGMTKNVFNVVSSEKNREKNYETKNTSNFQLFRCQQTQSLLITMYFIRLHLDQV
jgi:hypothetical protein